MAWHDLRPHRHTAKRLARRHTSYGSLFALIIMTGVVLGIASLLVASQTSASSSFISVTAEVPGPPPATAPTIVSPVGSATVTAEDLQVQGGCQSGLTVAIQRNDVYAGSVPCSSGVYQLTLSLYPGRNDLVAQQFDSLGQGSPKSPPVTVFFTSPTTSSKQPSGMSLASLIASPAEAATVSLPHPLSLQTDYQYLGAFPGNRASIWIDVENGTAPYAVEISWGDGNSDLASRPAAGRFAVDHTYSAAGTYSIRIRLSDAVAHTATINTVMIVNGAATSRQEPAVSPGQLEIAWPVFGLVLLLMLSFWLGEKRADHHLRTT